MKHLTWPVGAGIALLATSSSAQSSFPMPEEILEGVAIDIGEQERSLLNDDVSLFSKSVLETLPIALPTLPGENTGSVPARLALARAESSLRGQGSSVAFFRTKRIVGGTDAQPGEFPWQVALVLDGYPAAAGQFCGASIIDESHLLTAAHCLVATGPGDFYVRAGQISLLGTVSVQNRSVSAVILHQEYDSFSQANDIAVVRLQQPLDLSGPDAQSVELPDQNEFGFEPGDILTVTGWGDTSEGGTGSTVLKKVNVPAINLNTCNSSLFYSGSVLPGMLCAGIGGRDSCQGDSGGPLVRDRLQIGVVSWGYGCARPNRPGVYTDISFYRDWIETAKGR